VERLDRQVQLGEREAGGLERQPPRPAHGGGLEARLVAGFDQLEDGERVGDGDVGELGRRRAHSQQVAGL
jgi:hypothetical protein